MKARPKSSLRKHRMVTIGGGTGQFVLLSGLRDVADVLVTSIVSMVDSGGSTGRLRDELGVLPPGDILKCILALSPDRDMLRRLFLARFQKSRRLRGHNIGNMLLTALTQYTGSFSEGVAALGEILGTHGSILPVTTDRATLVAELSDGSRLFGESAIDLPSTGDRKRIERTYLVPHHSDRVRVYPPVLEAILEADSIVVGPGDLYTSIIPNFLVPGVTRAVARSRAPLVYVLNLMTKYGETDGFHAEDFLREAERHVGREFDVVVANSGAPPARVMELYRHQRSELVTFRDRDASARRHIVEADLLEPGASIIRHDSGKLTELLCGMLFGRSKAHSDAAGDVCLEK